MLTLNGKKFARTEKEAVESLFQPDGTCVGFYKPTRSQVKLFDLQGELIGVINPQGVLCCATKRDDGRYWFTYADIKAIGRYASCAQRDSECRGAIATHCKPKQAKPLAAVVAVLSMIAAPALSADLPDQFRQVCESPAVKSAKLEAACKAGEAPDALKDGSRFKATGIGAEVNTLFANVAFFVKA